MILNHPKFNSEIEIKENFVNILVIENKPFFRQMVSELINESKGIDGEFILFENHILEFSKNICVIVDPFSFDFSAKNFSSKINQLVLNTSNMFEDDKKEILEKINILGEKITNNVDTDIVYEPIDNLQSLFKILSFHIDENVENFIDKLLEYLKIQRLFFGIKIFIGINMHCYFTADELDLLYKQLFYEKINFIFVENIVPETKRIDEIYKIIDVDLCEF